MNTAPLLLVVRDPECSPPRRLAAFVDRMIQSGIVEKIFEGGRLTIVGDAATPRLELPDGSGLVWGTLFDRVTSWRISEPRKIDDINAPINYFVGRHWGGYVSIRLVEAAVQVFRDPSGAIPCYTARVDGAWVLTTRPALLFEAGLIKPEIDWTIIGQSIMFKGLRPARTALRGIDELMPGTCAMVEGDTVTNRTVWSPWRWATADQEIKSLDDAVERVRRVTTSCIGAWGRTFKRPLIELSGGLDSSIVAAVLGETNPNALCVTYQAFEGDPDETPFARAVADQAGLELEIMSSDMSAINVTRSAGRDLPRPLGRAFSQAYDAGLRTVAGREGADAFFSGGGGDNVFAYLRSVLPAIDRWKRGGGGLVGTINDVAKLAEVSFWEALAVTARRALRIRKPQRWIPAEGFMTRSAFNEMPFPHGHPWVDAPKEILPGKRVHGHALIIIQDHLEAFGRLQDAPIISPLLSQPLMETCLAIPTWLWCDGGINRAVARMAFSDRLPAMAINRQSKGGFSAYCTRLFEANRGKIEEMLLSGALAKQGLIDTHRISATLARPTVEKSDIFRVLELTDVEAWIDGWQSRPMASFAP